MGPESRVEAQTPHAVNNSDTSLSVPATTNTDTNMLKESSQAGTEHVVNDAESIAQPKEQAEIEVDDCFFQSEKRLVQEQSETNEASMQFTEASLYSSQKQLRKDMANYTDKIKDNAEEIKDLRFFAPMSIQSAKSSEAVTSQAVQSNTSISDTASAEHKSDMGEEDLDTPMIDADAPESTESAPGNAESVEETAENDEVDVGSSASLTRIVKEQSFSPEPNIPVDPSAEALQEALRTGNKLKLLKWAFKKLRFSQYHFRDNEKYRSSVLDTLRHMDIHITYKFLDEGGMSIHIKDPSDPPNMDPDMTDPEL